jgi:hypothetical protein
MLGTNVAGQRPWNVFPEGLLNTFEMGGLGPFFLKPISPS